MEADRVKQAGSAPVISAALSGLVVGIVVTLAVTGAMEHSAGLPKALPRATAVPVVATPRIDIFQAVARIVVRQLGQAYPNPKQARLVHLSVLPLSMVESQSANPLPNHSEYRTVHIVFRLNDHPLGKAWRFKAAKADVFRVLKGIYVSNLPVYSVRMVGTFPMQTKTGIRDQPVLYAYISHFDAAHIAWRKLDRSNEGLLWRTLTATHINPNFG